MLPAFGAPHEMRWHSYVQYLNMPSIIAWHLRHLPQAIKRFHRFIAGQYYNQCRWLYNQFRWLRRDLRGLHRTGAGWKADFLHKPQNDSICGKIRKLCCFDREKVGKTANPDHFHDRDLLEVMARFELASDGFADRCLTTWLHHHMK